MVERRTVNVREGNWQDVRSILDQVLESAVEERPRVILDLCGEDGLLRSAVEELVKSFESAGGFLAEPNVHDGDIGQDALAEGTVLGGYRIVRPIARGGQGIVYEAEQLMPARRVAIKTIDPAALSGSARRRFKHEVEAMGRLEHPGIARIYSADRASLGDETFLYLAMEFVDGSDVVSYSNERLLDIRERVELFSLVCDAVSFAHEHAVIHRDLKPGNILIAADGKPRILDFGLARLLEAAGSEVSTMNSRDLIGTLPYMSPEQTRMQNVDARADVYALGAILYELLTGEMAQPVSGCPLAEALRRIRTEEPAAARRLNRRISPDLDAIVRGTLAKEVEGRYLTAGDLRGDLRRYLKGESVLAKRSTPLGRGVRFCKRNKGLVTAVSAVIFALSAGVGASLWQMNRAQTAESVAMARANEMRGFATTIIFDVHDAIQFLPGSTKARKIMIEKAIDFLDRISVGTGQNTDADWMLIAEARIKVGDAQSNNLTANLGDLEGGRRSYGQAFEILKALLQRHPSDKARYLMAKVKSRPIYATMEMGTEDYSDDTLYMTYLREARDTLDELAVRMPATTIGPDLIAVHMHLAIAYRLRGDRGLSDESFAQSLKLADDLRARFPDSLEITRAAGEAMYRKGTLLQMSGDYDEAILCLEDALTTFNSLPDAGISSYVQHRTIGAKINLASCLAAKGDEGRMTDLLAEALASAKRMTLIDPDDKAAFRHVSVIPGVASEGYQLLAARPDISDSEKLRLLQLAKASMIETHALTIERDKRGWLAFWEQRYLPEQEASLADLDRQIQALETPASPIEQAPPGNGR